MQKKILNQKKHCALVVLQTDYHKGDFRNIQVLHKMIDPDNKRIINKRKDNRYPNGFLETQLFDDITHVIAEEVCNNSKYNELFKELYFARFPKVKDYIETIIKFNNSSKAADFINHVKDPEKGLLVFCLCDLVEEGNESLQFMGFYDPPGVNQFESMRENFRRSITSGQFPGTEDSIIGSPAYNKFARKLEEAIIAYINNGEETLEAAFSKIIKNMIAMEKKGFAFPEKISPILKKFIITNHNGNSAWFLQVINEQGEGKKYNYKPDINELFEDYCISYVYSSMYKNGIKGESFSKTYLARDVFPESMESVVESILDMYFMDIFYQMFEISQEQIYANFSWESYTAKSHHDVLIERINKLENENELLQSSNTALEKRVVNYETDLGSNNKIVSFDSLKEIKRLNSEVESLREKLLSQKDQLSLMEELLVQKEIEVDDTSEELQIDMELLQSKKYLFAGRSQEAFPQLKKLFPNSVFMTETTKDLTGIQVDAVVYLIKYISHSMYYKVKNSVVSENRPCINYNGKNMNKLLEIMQREVINLE